MSLHDRINRLRKSQYWVDEFSAGYDQAKFEAANLATEADDLMAEMAAILESASVGSIVINSSKDVLDKYEDWKEKSK